MKLPVGKISGEAVDTLFNQAITYHLNMYVKAIAEYEMIELYSNWRTIIRTIDELINIPGELKNAEEADKFLRLKFDFLNGQNLKLFKEVLDMLEKRFENNVSARFQQIAMMSYAINATYQKQGIYQKMGLPLNLSSTSDSISFFQSRRAYFVTTLTLIPQLAKGKKVVRYLDTLNFLQYTLDSCLIGITTSYYNLLLNQCLPDFEMTSDGEVATGNFDYKHLEGFFMEPERLSLMDQMELRSELVENKPMLPKAEKKVFSFSEVANAMALFEGAFKKYDIAQNTEFKELNSLFGDIAVYLKDDFNIIIDEEQFIPIAQKYPSLKLTDPTDNYFKALNSFAPFQRVHNRFFSTVVYLTRFVYRTLSQTQVKNRSFQINSGFVFEDKVSAILAVHGFTITGITRINHKEFDLITIKNGRVYNFQCKNNFIDITRVDLDYKKMGRLNSRLCNYYVKALEKEVGREKLIIDKTGIADIKHFVISRYPVITRNTAIINFTNLEIWIKKLP
ncbi:MAG TPA: hypothetical protein PL167_03510 [Cyclobacteriaceae bacterium]|nr:hypothetical protein [Cyclobacteriaceae bacterium]